MSPALAGKFFTTETPGKPYSSLQERKSWLGPEEKCCRVHTLMFQEASGCDGNLSSLSSFSSALSFLFLTAFNLFFPSPSLAFTMHLPCTLPLPVFLTTAWPVSHANSWPTSKRLGPSGLLEESELQILRMLNWHWILYFLISLNRMNSLSLLRPEIIQLDFDFGEKAPKSDPLSTGLPWLLESFLILPFFWGFVPQHQLQRYFDCWIDFFNTVFKFFLVM